MRRPGMALDQRHFPAARAQALGRGAAGQAGADHDRAPLRRRRHRRRGLRLQPARSWSSTMPMPCM
jgi:hypothetical protein